MLSAVLISKPSSLKACSPFPWPGGWERASQRTAGHLCPYLGSPRALAPSFPHTQHYSCKGHADASAKQSSDCSFIVSNWAVTPLPGNKPAPGCLALSLGKGPVRSPTGKKKGSRALCSSATRVRIKRHLPSCPELSRYSVRSQPNALAAPFLLSFCLAPLFFMRLVPKEVHPPPALPPSPRPHAGQQKSCSSQTTARVPLPGSNIGGPIQCPAGEVNINPHQMLGFSCGRGRSGQEEAPQPAAAAIIARARKGSHQREVGGGRVPASELASWGQAMVWRGRLSLSTVPGPATSTFWVLSAALSPLPAESVPVWSSFSRLLEETVSSNGVMKRDRGRVCTRLLFGSPPSPPPAFGQL